MAGIRDVVIVGGGHNALTAAAYLARAGLDVVVLERLEHTGGAAVSERPFVGLDARLSRYSYLVSLLPERIIDDLGLRIDLAKRRYSSYTPDPRADGTTGLLVDNDDQAATSASFERIGAAGDAAPFTEFYDHARVLTERLWPTLTEPLLTRAEARDLVLDGRDPRAGRVWDAMVEQPIGRVIAGNLADDLVRGVVLTDALIGTFAGADDADLAQNRCFLYHLLGHGDGSWDVPIGGMGRVTDELARAARAAGAQLRTGVEVTAIDADAGVVAVALHSADGREERIEARLVLVGVAPAVLDRLVGTPVAARRPTPEGAQVKVNLLLSRLPRLRDSAVEEAAAFAGTFHVNEGWARLEAARQEAAAGRIPDPLPLEIYCHSLTDPSILSPALQEAGAQTLTVFGLHVPHRLAVGDDYRERLRDAVLASLNAVLAEPIEDVVLTDADGEPCIEVRTTADLERDLAMPGGDIFHGALSWPWVEDGAALDSPAERWGVATAHERVLLCGSGARRGGAVSGIGGHNAAMAAIELLS